MCFRYADEVTGNIHERLLAVKESPVTTGKHLYDIFLTVMVAENLNWKEDLIGQSYDGASNMRGYYSGLQAHIKNECPQALYVWCHSHRLALVVKQAVSCELNSVDLFGNLETLYAFLWCSKKRAAIFRETQIKFCKLRNKKTQPNAVKRVSTTRWSSHSSALNVVLKLHSEVLETLSIIKKQEGTSDAVVGASCSGLITYLSSKRFILTALIFKTIFDVLEPVTRQLQSQDMDMLMATNILKNIIFQIKELRNDCAFEKILVMADEFFEKSEIDFLPLTLGRTKRVPKKSGKPII